MLAAIQTLFSANTSKVVEGYKQTLDITTSTATNSTQSGHIPLSGGKLKHFSES